MEVNMKKNFASAILTLTTAFGFAQGAVPEMLPNIAQREMTPALSLREKVTPKKSFGYLKMGVSDPELNKVDTLILPGFGIGYRFAANSSAIDISTSYNYRKSHKEEGRDESFHYVLPKLNYLYYLTADKENSLYAGGGLAWGGVSTREPSREKQLFVGLIPNMALGYEFNRTGALRSFIQVDVSQAAIAAYKEGALPKPFAELAIGGGF